MIVVTVQFVDATSSAQYNGGTSVIFQILAEAKAFAEEESRQLASAPAKSDTLTKVYNNGVLVQAWYNGTNITG